MNELEQKNEKTGMQERQDRLAKLEALIAAGKNPYPSKPKKKTDISKLLADFDKLEKSQKKLSIAGRVMSKREHGNLSFINIQDGHARIQVAMSKNELGADAYKEFIKRIDMGDFLEISGVCFVTHKGERSLMAKSWNILCKALLPLPDKWHGLKNIDDTLRKRYLDILLNPEIKDIFIKKSQFWDVTRAFMKKQGFLEVETPTLETTTGGAEAAPFRTHHNDYDLDVFLRISIGELWQKRLMAAGFEKTFEIGRAYRNEGSSPDHVQEFTNMEFYWAYADYRDGMKLTKSLYLEIAKKVFGTTKFEAKGHVFDLSDEWREIDYRDEVLKQTGIDLFETNKAQMEAKLKELGVKYDGDNVERLTDTLWKYCRKNIAGPAFLINHPKLVSPLAKAREKEPRATERFQIIIAGTEIGNGYSELNNPVDQKERFDLQQKMIEAGDDEAMMPDYEFVEMLEHGMPPTCGFGFGERLFTVLMGRPIRETTLFPLVRPIQSLTIIDESEEKKSL